MERRLDSLKCKTQQGPINTGFKRAFSETARNRWTRFKSHPTIFSRNPAIWLDFLTDNSNGQKTVFSYYGATNDFRLQQNLQRKAVRE